MRPHWTERFNGLPYSRDGQGPDAFNCWFFFAHVQKERFGRLVPIVPQPESIGAIARAFRDGLGRSGWTKVDRPQSGDGVLMAHLRHPSHVGVWVDDVAGGAVLHCFEGHGSALHSTFHLQAARWRITGFYRPLDVHRGEAR
jgi:hypothetical protein